MSKLPEINSVSDFLNWIHSCYKKNNSNKHLFFRGHSVSTYELIPSVFRNKFNEKDIILDFKQYAPVHNIQYDFIYECDKMLCDMQHFGLPTRLLDWTINPLIALYFSCQNSSTPNVNADGQLFTFNPWDYNKKVIGTGKTPQMHDIHIAMRSLLAYGWKFSEIKECLQRKYIKVELTENDIQKPFSYVAPYTNNRKTNQRGCFTIFGIDKHKFDYWIEAKESLDSVIIKAKKKNNILEELNLLYVNEYSVYPDFEGMSNMIKKWGSLFNFKNNIKHRRAAPKRAKKRPI